MSSAHQCMSPKGQHAHNIKLRSQHILNEEQPSLALANEPQLMDSSLIQWHHKNHVHHSTVCTTTNYIYSVVPFIVTSWHVVLTSSDVHCNSSGWIVVILPIECSTDTKMPYYQCSGGSRNLTFMCCHAWNFQPSWPAHGIEIS